MIRLEIKMLFNIGEMHKRLVLFSLKSSTHNNNGPEVFIKERKVNASVIPLHSWRYDKIGDEWLIERARQERFIRMNVCEISCMESTVLWSRSEHISLTRIHTHTHRCTQICIGKQRCTRKSFAQALGHANIFIRFQLQKLQNLFQMGRMRQCADDFPSYIAAYTSLLGNASNADILSHRGDEHNKFSSVGNTS